ncbi:distal tail protein Dit [Eremococcus coleocola]|uniref:distal tail protein Dit n=1 Tax=Eremococcus coleocola TaxID=88132 RepID=UPI000406F8B8|nr:distal tail protein Dit [Eremococcus coleocola]
MIAYIEFNGVSSSSLGLRIINKVSHESTGWDIETVTVPGRDGDLLLSNNRLKSVVKSFPMRLQPNDNLTKAEDRISDWLNVLGYKDLKLSWDPKFIYFATVIETFEIEEVLRQFGNLKVNFLCKPIKIYTDSIELKSFSGGTLENKGNTIAKPIIELVGSGDGVLTINGRQTKLQGVQEGITLDMQRNMIYYSQTAKWNNVVRSEQYQLPYLDLGKNEISMTGSFQMKIAPYWGVKL